MGQATSFLKLRVSSERSDSRFSTPRSIYFLKHKIQRWGGNHSKFTSSKFTDSSFEEYGCERSLATSIQAVVAPFLHGLGYKPSSQLENDRLWSASLAKASSMGISCSEKSANRKRLKVGFSYAHHCYPGHPLEVQVYITIFTLFAQSLDDFTPEGMQDIENFHQRLCAGEQQPTAILEGWAQLILEAHKYWSPVPANLIVSSVLNFITSTIIENKRLIHQETQIRSGKSWAYYLRSLDGLGDAFAIFTFPSALYPDISQFLQAVPDMAMYIVFANDIISFYKEEIAGEKDNYLHSRARYDGKDVVDTLQDTVKDTEACYLRIRELFALCGAESQAYSKAWKCHEQGYIDFHMFSGRYKLEELGLPF